MKEQQAYQFEEFFKTVPLSQRILVTYLCSTIRDAAPRAREEFKHKMLHWKFTSTDLVALMAQKDYVFIYFGNKTVLEKYSSDLSSVLYGKHYLRFRDINDVPFGFENLLAEAFCLDKVAVKE